MGAMVFKIHAVKFSWTRAKGFSKFRSRLKAQVAELADAVDSKSTTARFVGSTPTLGTKFMRQVRCRRKWVQEKHGGSELRRVALRIFTPKIGSRSSVGDIVSRV